MNTEQNTKKALTETKPVLVEGLSLDQWIEKETTKRKVRWWGEEHEIEPVICETIIGDGLQLVYLSTIDQRPNYWLIRIDSKTIIDDGEFDFETILTPLEEDFGRVPDEGWLEESEFKELKEKGELEDFENVEDYQSDCKYPALSWAGGSWGLIVNMATGDVGF